MMNNRKKLGINRLICKKCGKRLTKKDDIYQCEFCQTIYKKNIIQESKEDKLKNLLTMIKKYIEKEKFSKVEKLAEIIKKECPLKNIEVNIYLLLAKNKCKDIKQLASIEIVTISGEENEFITSNKDNEQIKEIFEILQMQKQKSSVFENNTWKTIKKISNNISKQNLNEEEIEKIYGWKIGDKKRIYINNIEYQVQIIGFNHDDKAKGKCKAGITLQMVDLLNDKYSMNNINRNVGGWKKSKMRKKTMPYVKKSMTKDLQDVIEKVKKKSANGGYYKYSKIDTTKDQLFLLSGVELFGNKQTKHGNSNSNNAWAHAGEYEGKQYSYWAKHDSYITDLNGWHCYKDMIKKNTNWWWLRSSTCFSISFFCSVSIFGDTSSCGSLSKGGVCFCFCV